MVRNIGEDIKWECEDCGHVWYEDELFNFVECIKCGSENITED